MSQKSHAIAVADSFVFSRHRSEVLTIIALHFSLELLSVNVLHADELEVIAFIILNLDRFLQVKYHIFDI